MRGFVGEYFPSPECSEYLTPREGICQKTCVEGDEEMFLCITFVREMYFVYAGSCFGVLKKK